jgi:hypothetical protein
VGVELQAHLVERARQTAAELALGSAVDFVHADAGDGAPDGTVFFIYASFNGELLQRVLDRLQERARTRRIILCAVDFEVAAPWLTPRRPSRGELTIYDAQAPAC